MNVTLERIQVQCLCMSAVSVQIFQGGFSLIQVQECVLVQEQLQHSFYKSPTLINTPHLPASQYFSVPSLTAVCSPPSTPLCDMAAQRDFRGCPQSSLTGRIHYSSVLLSLPLSLHMHIYVARHDYGNSGGYRVAVKCDTATLTDRERESRTQQEHPDHLENLAATLLPLLKFNLHSLTFVSWSTLGISSLDQIQL